MTDFSLRRGETKSCTFALFDAAGAAFNVSGYTVTLAIDGRGIHTTKVATLNSPSTLGTGFFSFLAADYATLLPTLRASGARIADAYVFEIWCHDADEEIHMLTGTMDIVDVPQRTP